MSSLNTLMLSLVLLGCLLTTSFSFPQEKITKDQDNKVTPFPCSPATCTSCLASCDGCRQCGLCALCFGNTAGLCSQCKYCKGGAEACKESCNEGKKSKQCETCLENCS